MARPDRGRRACRRVPLLLATLAAVAAAAGRCSLALGAPGRRRGGWGRLLRRAQRGGWTGSDAFRRWRCPDRRPPPGQTDAPAAGGRARQEAGGRRLLEA